MTDQQTKRAEEEKFEMMMQYLSMLEKEERKKKPPKPRDQLQQNKTWRDRLATLEQIDKEIFGRNFF